MPFENLTRRIERMQLASRLARAQKTVRQLTHALPSGLPEVVPPCPRGEEALRFLDPRQALVDWDNKQVQWWYFTGHLRATPDSSGTERRFAFELVFFDRRTNYDYFGILPSRLIAPQLWVAHFAITDIDRKQFHYSHRGGLMDPSEGIVSPDRFHVQIDGWSARQTPDGHLRIHAADGRESLSLDLEPLKSLVHHQADGYSPRGPLPEHASFYCSYPRLRAEGQLTVDGKVHEVHGQSWMDHEKMTMNPELLIHGWDWFSIQLESGDELMLYLLKDKQSRNSSGFCREFSFGTLITRKGDVVPISGTEIETLHLQHWTSPKTGARYPTALWVQIPSQEIRLEIKALVENCELDVTKNCFLSYWEGPIEVSARFQGRSLGGTGFLELVGYDRRISTRLLHFLVVPEPHDAG